ncbi:MAG: glycosyltransferase family 4 protein [Opitutales bacterium]|nr:glycosyltransferase family 4 protein [Opitutales bacterium]
MSTSSPTPLKVCWLHEKRGAQGGAEANVLETALALRARGFENTLAHRETTGVDEARWDEAFAGSVHIPPGTPAAPLLAHTGADLLWIHNWNHSEDFENLRALGRPRARMIHDHAMYCMRHYKYHPLTRRNCTRPASLACIFPCLAPVQRGSGRWPLRLASFSAKLREIAHNRSLDRLVVNSTFMEGELRKNGFSPEKIDVLPPLPPERALPAGLAATPAEPGHLLFAGQVIRGKGLDHLLQALHGLSGDWSLTVAGRGSALDKCRALASRLGLDERIEWLGHLSPEELARQYRRAALVAVPSVWQEPFGMIGIEAMRHGRPVVAYASGGIPEWMRDGEHGRLVPTGDIPALRAALVELLADPARLAVCGERAREWVRAHFSFEGYIDRLADRLRAYSLSFRKERG